LSLFFYDGGAVVVQRKMIDYAYGIFHHQLNSVKPIDLTEFEPINEVDRSDPTQTPTKQIAEHKCSAICFGGQRWNFMESDIPISEGAVLSVQ